MTATVIDGKAFAAKVRGLVGEHVAKLKADHGITPGLAVVLVGEDPASQVYVRSKHKATVAANMESFEHRLPADTSDADLLALVERLNNDAAVDGILVQLPLPGHLDEQAVIAAISPDKDVDGFHLINVGRLSTGDTAAAFVPCTPAGSMLLIREVLGDDLSGKHVVVIGRSILVGKPLAQLLLAAEDAPHPLALACTPRSGDEALKSGGGKRLNRHPTFGLWPVALADDLRAALEDGLRKVVLWTDRHGAGEALFPAEPFDPFFNVNTPEDLARARELAS